MVRNIAHNFYLEEALAAYDPARLAELEALRDARDRNRECQRPNDVRGTHRPVDAYPSAAVDMNSPIISMPIFVLDGAPPNLWRIHKIMVPSEAGLRFLWVAVWVLGRRDRYLAPTSLRTKRVLIPVALRLAKAARNTIPTARSR